MIKYLAGPVIGALIGYCTNYIPVKMLFYPKKEIRLFGHRLPFTPGAIPKGKERLAKAVGAVVGNTLITKEDVENRLQSEAVGKEIAGFLCEGMETPVRQGILELTKVPEEEYAEKKKLLAGRLSEMIANALGKADLTGLITEKGTAVIKEKLKGTMFSMFLSDDLIASVAGPVGAEIQTMLSEHGAEYIQPEVEEKLEALEEESLLGLLEQAEIQRRDMEELAESVCNRLLHRGIDRLFAVLDIQKMVEDKIREMSVDELENLVFTVMKKELNTIVNLGAVIGLLLGLLNNIL